MEYRAQIPASKAGRPFFRDSLNTTRNIIIAILIVLVLVIVI